MTQSTLPLRLGSLKTRTAVAIAAVIAAVLILNGFYLILARRAEMRREVEDRAMTFARLTRALLADAFRAEGAGSPHFRAVVHDSLRLQPDVERILIVDRAGRPLFDSLEEGSTGVPRDTSPSPHRGQDAVGAGGDVVAWRQADGHRFEVVASQPAVAGARGIAIVYQVTYYNVKAATIRLIYATAALTLLSMIAGVAVALALATRITRPLEELTAGARAIADGRFDRRLAIRSDDEIEVLAEAFNEMRERLKQNVDDLEASNEKLAALNEELKRLDRTKSDLLANVSHELRTPLTAIKGYTEYILDRKLGAVTEKQEKGLIVVQRNVDRLSKTICALLDFSRMDVGKLVLNLQPFSLAGLVEGVRTTLRSELDKKRLVFSAEIDPLLPPIIADRERLSAVFENLIINAIKFTPNGGRITVSASRSGTRPLATITVADTGIGIPRDQLGKIFNRFHQVEASSTRRFGGVGLGLAIVKSILDAHSAAVHVESDDGRGAAFRFTLPTVDRIDDERGRAPSPTVFVAENDSEVQRTR